MSVYLPNLTYPISMYLPLAYFIFAVIMAGLPWYARKKSDFRGIKTSKNRSVASPDKQELIDPFKDESRLDVSCIELKGLTRDIYPTLEKLLLSMESSDKIGIIRISINTDTGILPANIVQFIAIELSKIQHVAIELCIKESGGSIFQVIIPPSDENSLKVERLTLIPNRSKVSVTSVDEVFLEKVIRITEINLENQAFTVDSLAYEMNMSVSQLNRKLNILIGYPAGSLMRTLRLQRAADLLMQKSETIAVICYQLGFNDHAYFSRAFKKQFGCTPSEYTKRLDKQ